MKKIGLCVLAIGVVILLFGVLKSGAAEYSNTLNIGLLNDKTNLTLAGGFTAIIGAIFAAAGTVLEQLQAASSHHDGPVARSDL